MSIFADAQHAHEAPPEEWPDYLFDKALGVCPWCGRQLNHTKTGAFCWCHNWADDETEEENRCRYFDERLQDDKFEARVSREERRLERDF